MSFRPLILSWLLLGMLGTPALAQFFIPIYSADPARRTRQMIYTSENLRNLQNQWERLWFLDQPSALTPFPNYGGGSSFGPVARGSSGRRSLGPGTTSSRIVGRPPVRADFPGAVVRHSDRRFIRGVDGPKAKKTEAEEMRELFALGERAEKANRTNLAKIYFRMVANNAEGALREIAQAKLDTLSIQTESGP